ncbi:HAMP domain-containing sensor histidine kinase [Methyloceanibacter sp.]|uniref:sensor histidine kinase n=1 Tax=Methyloceanibacter sp. TaxID=1965321 RepID=UPI002BEB8B04|nr:HAMP domain-containing sensor histidine kinase [Methyloceanibacter sp.]HML91082.1 HAMP domain-containing sensor histidine kinase [Methyloceanibacter sp.]
MTPDQMKAALGVGLAFLFAACATLTVIISDGNGTGGTLTTDRLSLARDGIAQYARDHGWARAKEMLQQADSIGADRPHAWLLEKADNRLVDAEAEYPVEVALRALSKTGNSVVVERGDQPSRLHISEAALADSRLLIGIVAPHANQLPVQVVYAVLWTSLAGMLGAFVAVFWASRRSNRRIGDIGATLSAFLSGDMTKRVVFPGPVDSLYVLAYNVNRTLDQSETLAHNLTYLSSDIAHNLKKPLTRLRSRLEDVRDAAEMTPCHRAIAGRAVGDVDGIIAIFEAMLNIVQFQAGTGRSRFQNVDLRALTSHIIETFDSIIDDSGKTLRTSLPDKVPTVRGDPRLIMELVVNIVENAIQHCPSGTTISISVVSSSDDVSIIVSDDGPGVPAEAVEAVLQRFHRLDASRPGHGIGMPFAVAVAQLHNAILELADNDPGLRVTISFPIDFSALTPQLGLRMRSGLELKLQSARQATPNAEASRSNG